MGKKPGGYTELLLRRIPRAVKRRFKARCARNGVTMQEAMVKFMREYVK